MTELEQLLDKINEEKIPIKNNIVELIVERLSDINIQLNNKQLKDLEEKVGMGLVDGTKFPFLDKEDQLINKHFPNGGNKTENSIFHIDDEEKINEVINTTMNTIMLRYILDYGTKKFIEVTSNKKNILEEIRIHNQKIIDSNIKLWGRAFDFLEIFLDFSYSIGSKYNNIYRLSIPEGKDSVSEVLTRIQARGCQIGNEILTLLRNGYADGAHARWRTLHELTIVAGFISKHGLAWTL